MRGVAWRPRPSAQPEASPYRHLAVRVIDQAFRDLARSASSPAGQESARAFLAGSPMLHHWCEVADLDPACLAARATKVLASYAPTETMTLNRSTRYAETEKNT